MLPLFMSSDSSGSRGGALHVVFSLPDTIVAIAGSVLRCWTGSAQLSDNAQV